MQLLHSLRQCRLPKDISIHMYNQHVEIRRYRIEIVFQLILVCITLFSSGEVFDRTTLMIFGQKSDPNYFVGFFIFVGNIGMIPAVKNLIEELLSGKEIIFSALISQAISNVPAALMLSGFTDNGAALLVGVNIGGLGTLIASMASLISYKFVAAALPDKKGKYLLVFSVLNFALLGAMIFFSLII